MDIKLKVGQRIRELRQTQKLSQEALANKANVDRTYMTDLENGRRNVSIEVLKRVTDALDITFTEFFTTSTFYDKGNS
jgi:transcriptional regulator with XRE-family HTH domain